MKEVREPTPEDEIELNNLVKELLGEQATGEYLGAKAKGIKGDEAFYGHAVVITDPAFFVDGKFTPDYDRIQKVSSEISAKIHIAGNVTINLVPPGESSSP